MPKVLDDWTHVVQAWTMFCYTGNCITPTLRFAVAAAVGPSTKYRIEYARDHLGAKPSDLRREPPSLVIMSF